MDRFTRRTLVQRGLAASPLLLAPAGLPGTALAARRRSRPIDGALPSARDVRRQVLEMVEPGPRLTATSPHLQFIDSLEEDFRGAGLSVTRDPQPFRSEERRVGKERRSR